MSTLAAPRSLDTSVLAETPAVEVRDLRKDFVRRNRKAGLFARKRWPAIQDVTFTMARGECVAILGQNGSGKSTLVRLLSTLLINDGGEAMENLSRGMQQKVALARALLTSPVLLLLDEPTTGLDPRSKQEVQNFIREIRERHDSTILLCTHDMKEAEDLADRVGLLDRGELLFLEPVEDVKDRYRVDTLEEAFFAATGRTFEDEKTEDDEEREVFA